MLGRFAPGIRPASGPGSVMRDVRKKYEASLAIHNFVGSCWGWCIYRFPDGFIHRYGNPVFLCFGPLLVTLTIAIITKSEMAQLALLVLTIGYAAWFYFMYYQVISTPDAQSAIGFMFVGALASPFLILFWIASSILEIHSRRKSLQK